MGEETKSAKFSPIPFLVAFASALPFLPSLRNGFVNLDDEWNLVFNWRYQGLGPAQLRWMFAGSIGHGNYEPLHWLVLAVVHAIAGPGPAGYHAAALLLHAAVAVLLYFTGVELLALASGGVRSREKIELCAAAGALMFATHPLRAEAVCWVSAQHYPLATLFALLSVLAYLRWRSSGDGKWRWLSVAAFTASQLSLPVALTLPVSLVIIDLYPLRRTLTRELVLEKWPYLLPASLGVATWFARAVVLRIPSNPHPLDALVLPWSSVYFCLKQALLPIGLRPIYQPAGGIHAGDPGILLSAAFMLAVTAGLAAKRREWTAALAAWCSFVAALLPVSGAVSAGLFPSYPADRYSYLPSLAPAVLAAGGLLFLAGRSERAFKAGLLCAGLLCLGWATLSWHQTGIWRDSLSLWSRAASEGEDGPTVNIGMGYTLVEQGRIDAAIPRLTKAIEQEPSAMLPYYTLGFAFDRLGKPQEAFRYFGLALERDHDSAAAWNASGSELARMGRLKDAQTCFEQAIKHDPQHPGARMNLAMSLAAQGQMKSAIEEYLQALEINPNFHEARCNLALDLMRSGHADEAAEQFREVMRRDPNYLRSRGDLRGVLTKLGLMRAA